MATKRKKSRRKTALQKGARGKAPQATGRKNHRAPFNAGREGDPQEESSAGQSEVDAQEKALASLKGCGGRLEAKPDPTQRIGKPGQRREPIDVREYLIWRLLSIRGKNGRLGQLMLNRAQQELERSSTKRNIVLKARQLGVTTYVAARFFINTITREGTLSVQVAHDQRSAEEIFRIVHRFLENLPESLRQGALVTSRANVRQIVFPGLDSEYRVETAADDSVQTAWEGQYKIASDFLTVEDVVPGDAVQVAAPSRGANFSAVVRKVDLTVVSLVNDRSHYDIAFANDAAQPMALKFEAIVLPAPVTTIYTAGTPSSSLYIASLTGAQITNVIASQITIDAGMAPLPGGGIEVRRSDGGWGPGDGGNLAGRFTTEGFTLPRLSKAQSYYMRQYDGSSPAKYSRYSALLYADYPM